MAFTHGVNSVFSLDNAAGALASLTAFLTSVSGLPGSADVAETTVMGTAGLNRTYIRSLRDQEFSIEGRYDSTATTGPDAILQAALTADVTKTFEWGPEGGTTGKVKYTGESFCTSYETSADFDGVVAFSADFKVTAGVTKTTFI